MRCGWNCNGCTRRRSARTRTSSKVEYTVGDDGELIEVDSADRDDKPKRDGL